MHKFDVNNKNKLDNPRRREMLPVDRIIKEIGIKQNECFVDVGCGIGYFSLPIADEIRDFGMVYALDIESEMLEEVKQRAKEQELTNIATIKTNEYDFMLESEVASSVLICTVIHEVEDKIKFVSEAYRIMQNHGKLTIIEWIKEDMDWGPPKSHRVSANETTQVLKACKFKEINYIQVNQYYYMITGIKEE